MNPCCSLDTIMPICSLKTKQLFFFFLNEGRSFVKTRMTTCKHPFDDFSYVALLCGGLKFKSKYSVIVTRVYNYFFILASVLYVVWLNNFDWRDPTSKIVIHFCLLNQEGSIKKENFKSAFLSKKVGKLYT